PRKAVSRNHSQTRRNSDLGAPGAGPGSAPDTGAGSRSASSTRQDPSSAATSRAPIRSPSISTVYRRVSPGAAAVTASPGRRSEEHTSELQSREKLVCRLLLEKKKT